MSSKIIESISYSYIGRLIEPYLAEFEGLKTTLRKAGIDQSLRMYLSVRLFWAIILSVVSLVFLIAIKIAVTTFSWILVLMLPILILVTMFVFTWVYPSYLVGERKRKLEAALPTAASYMTAMASAGVTPDKIFLSLSREKIGEAIVKEEKATQELTKKKQVKETSSKKPSLVQKRKTLIDIKQALISLSTLPAVQDSTRDYIIFNNKLYIAPDGATEVNSDSVVSLADGSFIADEYIPRLYLEKGEIVAIELWTKS
ncbi:hypothetical protein ES705_42557 [subsurface metagenome]